MHIGGCHSHLNGLEWMRQERAGLLLHIKRAIRAVKATKGKPSKEKAKKGKKVFSPKKLNIQFKRKFEGYGWRPKRLDYWVTQEMRILRDVTHMEPESQRDGIEVAGAEAIPSYTTTDFVKGRVAVEVQFGKYAFLAYDLFVKHMISYSAGEIDVGVEIVAMKEMQRGMSTGPGYYEWVLSSLARQGRTFPPMPLVIIGVTPFKPRIPFDL